MQPLGLRVGAGKTDDRNFRPIGLSDQRYAQIDEIVDGVRRVVCNDNATRPAFELRQQLTHVPQRRDSHAGILQDSRADLGIPQSGGQKQYPMLAFGLGNQDSA
jgi:hypothetical protein